MNDTTKDIPENFQTLLDYTNKIENKLDKTLQNMFGSDQITANVIAKYVSIDVLSLLNELQLNEKQLDIVKKHITQLSHTVF